MKKVLIPLALFVGVSVSAEAAIQTFSASDTGGSTRSKLNSNFSELDTTKETKAVVQASAPADTTVDWYDTDQEAGVLILKRHNGTTWVRASSHGVQYATSCASISAGMCVDTDDGKLYYHNGMAVVEVGTGDGSIPTASAETLGGVKIGSRLTITDGVLSADVQTTDISGKENSLGNPSANGYVLSSTTSGVRSWVEMTGGGTGIAHAASDGNYYASKDGGWTSLSGVFAAPLGSDDNYVTDSEKVKISNLSGTNTGDQDLSSYATSSSVLTKTNTTSFIPSGDYHPATKKYVDDSITASGGYTDEQAQDAVGAMVYGNTETGISVNYDDTTGKLNFVVSGGGMTYPGAGVANSTGSAWGTSYTVGTGASNLVQLNSSSQLPAVSGALLTDTFTGTIISGQTTHKGAIQALATELDNAVDITEGTGIDITNGVVSVTVNTYQAYDADWLGITSNGASLVSAANYAAMRTLLDLEAGTDFYSMSAADTAFQKAVGATYSATASTTTATGNINIDGVSADHYYFNNGSSTATYTPVITSPPVSGKERAIVLTVGGGTGVITMTWTNVSFIGAAGAATTTASKYSHYGCFIPSSGKAKCKIIAEASDN